MSGPLLIDILLSQKYLQWPNVDFIFEENYGFLMNELKEWIDLAISPENIENWSDTIFNEVKATSINQLKVIFDEVKENINLSEISD